MNKINWHLFSEIIKINFIYSAILNVKHFGWAGIRKMPIIIQYGSTFRCKPKEGIVFLKKIHLNMLTIKKGNTIEIQKGGSLLLTGDKACFNRKNKVLISSSGTIEIGNNFWVNELSEFFCRKKLKFGEDILIGSHVLFMDTDYHPMFNLQNEIINHDKEIEIGNKVWIASNVTILKGTCIGSNIIIGAGSLVSGNLLVENSIYCGNPVKILKNDIRWSVTHPDYWVTTQ